MVEMNVGVGYFEGAIWCHEERPESEETAATKAVGSRI